MTGELHHLAGAYVLNALDDDERRRFEEHYEQCDICSQEVAEFQAVAKALGETAAVQPPAGLKAKVMAEIDTTRQDSPLGPAAATTAEPAPSEVADLGARRSRKAPGSVILAAAAAVLLLAGVFAVTLRGSDTTSTDEVVSAPDALVTALDATTADDLGSLQVVWSDELDKVAIVGSGLPELDADQAYALWFLLDEGVAPAGLFSPEDGSISIVLPVDDLPLTGWGITVEPASGSDQPTSDVIFAGAI